MSQVHNLIANIVYDAEGLGERHARKAYGRLLLGLLKRHSVLPDSIAYQAAESCVAGVSFVGAATREAARAGVTVLELEAIAHLAAATQPTTENHAHDPD